jgi:hypothetical protein
MILRWAEARLEKNEPRIRDPYEMKPIAELQFGQTRYKRLPNSYWEPEKYSNIFYLLEIIRTKAAAHPAMTPVWYLLVIFSVYVFWLAMIEQGKWLAMLILLIIAQMIPALTANFIAGEREEETWEMLKLTTSGANAIYYGKLKSSLITVFLRAGIAYGLPLAIGNFLYFVVNVLRWRHWEWESWQGVGFSTLIVHIPIAILHIFFITILCIWFSSRHRTVYTVYGWSYFTISVYLFGPVLLWILYGEIDLLWRMDLLHILNPFLILADFQMDDPSARKVFFEFLLQMILFSVLARFLMKDTIENIREQDE